MNIADDYEPIGFVAVPSAVTHIQWSPAAHVSFILDYLDYDCLVS